MSPTSRPLSDIVFMALPTGRDRAQLVGNDADALETRLAELVAAGQRAWPTVVVDPGAFVRHLAERLPEGGSVLHALDAIHAEDLYLAHACMRGERHALAAFDQTFLSQLALYLARSDALPAFTDEVRQLLRERLLVARVGLPRIASYSGRGPLGGWLRMTAARIAIDLRRAHKPGIPLDDAPALRSPAVDPELRYLRASYGREFSQAFHETLSSLSAREATLLRLHYLEGMTAEGIGTMYRVHARTVRKWIEQSRAHIAERTRRLLRDRLQVSERDLESMMWMLQSQLDVSIRRFLTKTKE